MDINLAYALLGAVLFGIAFIAFFSLSHLLKQLMAFNIMGSGCFLILVGLPQSQHGVDPVPQALVLTGIVVAVSATALALILIRRYWIEGGDTCLPEHKAEQSSRSKS